MKRDGKLLITKWHSLSSEGKDQLRNWAVKHGYELDLIPGSSVDFDPACEYAALLTKEQMRNFLLENDHAISDTSSSEVLWKSIVKVLD